LIVVQEEQVYHHYQLGDFQDAKRHDLQPDLITYNASMSAPWCGFFHRHEVWSEAEIRCVLVSLSKISVSSLAFQDFRLKTYL